MDDTELGVYRKFEVRRLNPDMERKHQGCRYFVLDLQHDQFAVPALSAYASACEHTYPVLAKDIRDFLRSRS